MEDLNLELTTEQERKMLVMELRGMERYRIANRFDITPSRVTDILRKPSIEQLRIKVCDKIDDLLFGEKGVTTNGRNKSDDEQTSE